MKPILSTLALAALLSITAATPAAAQTGNDLPTYSARREKHRTQKPPQPTEADYAAVQAVRRSIDSLARYERKAVVPAPGATAADLYTRAREALADWTGPGGNSEVNLDYTDKDAGTITYKGHFSLGFKAINIFGTGFSRYADFTLRVRCKDGRAQVIVSVPTITAYANDARLIDHPVTRPVSAALEALDQSHTSRKANARTILLSDIYTGVESLLAAMSQALAAPSDDDF